MIPVSAFLRPVLTWQRLPPPALLLHLVSANVRKPCQCGTSIVYSINSWVFLKIHFTVSLKNKDKTAICTVKTISLAKQFILNQICKMIPPYTQNLLNLIKSCKNIPPQKIQNHTPHTTYKTISHTHTYICIICTTVLLTKFIKLYPITHTLLAKLYP